MNHSIQVLDPHQLDLNRWDDCVNNSSNCLIYGLAEYLNHTTDNWKGVVLGDYEAVMPIPWRRKFGITYCYNVPFLQQGGPFTRSQNLSVEKAIAAIRSVCSYGYYYFNYAQATDEFERLSNMILPLNGSLSELEESFTADAKRIIRKVANNNWTYTDGSIDEAITLSIHNYAHRVKISEAQYKSFATLCNRLAAWGGVIVKKIVNAKNETLANVLLLKHRNRLYNIINSVTNEGRKTNANYLLYYSIFRDYCGGDYIFDFEGSDLPGVAAFYRQFTFINQPYYRYHFNNLPLVMKIFTQKSPR